MKCETCKSICSFVQTNLMDGIGNSKNPDIMFLGDAPDKFDDEAGEPFTGGSGLWFKKNILRPLSIPFSEYYFTNAVKCRPTKKQKFSQVRVNANPDRRLVINCRPHLEAEIKRVKPKVILVLGNAALCSIIFGDKISGITNWQGKFGWSVEFNCWIMFTHNPFFVMMDAGRGLSFKYNQMIEDVKKAQELAVTDPPKLNIPVPEYLTDESSVLKYLKNAWVDTNLVLDLETDLFDPRNEILGIALAYSDGKKIHPVYIPWEIFNDSERASEALSELLMSKKIRKIGHNISFDRKFLHCHGFDMVDPISDTMSMAHLLDENFSIGLKERTWIDLGFGGYEVPLEKFKFENKFTKKTSYKKIPNDIMSRYAAYDALATYKLYKKYIPLLQKEKLYPLYEKVTSPVLSVMTEASMTGIHVDMEQANKLDERMTIAKKRLEARIYKLAGFKFNFMSTPQLSRLLFEDLHAPNMGRTKAGSWKCDKATLTLLAKKTVNKKYVQIAQNVLKYKYLDKMQGTYIGQAKEFVWDDGRIHSSYNQCGTVTGRTSNSKPCTHNIPQDRLIRSLYCASPGNVLIEADIKAAEMRAIAICSGDEVLLSIVNSNEDIHKQTFREIFNKPKDYEPSDMERRIAKSINFGLIYGITAVGLARRLGISTEEAQRYIDLYFKRFSGVAEWIENTIKFVRKHGYVRSALMRKRRLPEAKSDDKYVLNRIFRQAMNSPIQSVAADWTYIGMVRVAKEFKKQHLRSKIIHTVHDCILVDAIPSEVKRIKKIINWAFSTQIKALPIEMKVDIEVGHRWGEKKESALETILADLAA